MISLVRSSVRSFRFLWSGLCHPLEDPRLMKNQSKLICPHGASIHYQLLIPGYCDPPVFSFWARMVSLGGNV